jgi:hypothetical protein
MFPFHFNAVPLTVCGLCLDWVKGDLCYVYAHKQRQQKHILLHKLAITQELATCAWLRAGLLCHVHSFSCGAKLIATTSKITSLFLGEHSISTKHTLNKVVMHIHFSFVNRSVLQRCCSQGYFARCSTGSRICR